jgi:hypothetical protein
MAATPVARATRARKGDLPMVIKRFEPLSVGKVAGVLYAVE